MVFCRNYLVLNSILHEFGLNFRFCTNKSCWQVWVIDWNWKLDEFCKLSINFIQPLLLSESWCQNMCLAVLLSHFWNQWILWIWWILVFYHFWCCLCLFWSDNAWFLLWLLEFLRWVVSTNWLSIMSANNCVLLAAFQQTFAWLGSQRLLAIDWCKTELLTCVQTVLKLEITEDIGVYWYLNFHVTQLILKLLNFIKFWIIYSSYLLTLDFIIKFLIYLSLRLLHRFNWILRCSSILRFWSRLTSFWLWENTYLGLSGLKYLRLGWCLFLFVCSASCILWERPRLRKLLSQCNMRLCIQKSRLGLRWILKNCGLRIKYIIYLFFKLGL